MVQHPIRVTRRMSPRLGSFVLDAVNAISEVETFLAHQLPGQDSMQVRGQVNECKNCWARASN